MFDKGKYADWSAEVTDRGGMLARELKDKRPVGPLRPNYHVVCAVEDFETIGRSVRATLSPDSNVSFSCLWTQYEILSHTPLIERCPVFRAFHEDEPTSRYSLVMAVSNIGSISPLRSMIVHMVLEEGFDRFSSIDVLCPSAFEGAREALSPELPEWLADRVSWGKFDPEPHVGIGGYGTSLYNLTPSILTGLGDHRQREDYTPEEIRLRIETLPRRRREPKSPGVVPKPPGT